MTNKQIFKHIRALAHEECANCHAGNCALTDERCHIINTNYQSVQDGAIDCDYFLEVVLPADWDLQDLVAYALWYGGDDSDTAEETYPQSLRQCDICQQPYWHTAGEPEQLAEKVIASLSRMSDDEFDQLVSDIAPDFMIDQY